MYIIFTSFHDCTNKIICFFLKIIQASEKLARWFSIKRRSVQPYLSLLQTLPRGWKLPDRCTQKLLPHCNTLWVQCVSYFYSPPSFWLKIMEMIKIGSYSCCSIIFDWFHGDKTKKNWNPKLGFHLR